MSVMLLLDKVFPSRIIFKKFAADSNQYISLHLHQTHTSKTNSIFISLCKCGIMLQNYMNYRLFIFLFFKKAALNERLCQSLGCWPDSGVGAIGAC